MKARSKPLFVSAINICISAIKSLCELTYIGSQSQVVIRRIAFFFLALKLWALFFISTGCCQGWKKSSLQKLFKERYPLGSQRAPTHSHSKTVNSSPSHRRVRGGVYTPRKVKITDRKTATHSHSLHLWAIQNH